MSHTEPRSIMNILQINSHDSGGGAEIICQLLHQHYAAAGHRSKTAVGYRLSDDEHIIELDNFEGLFRLLAQTLGIYRSQRRLPGHLRRFLRAGNRFSRFANFIRGDESVNSGGIWRLLAALDPVPDIVHCHNLHNHYFDLRALPKLSSTARTVVTLHDAWMLSGHCVHSFDCERWKTGCGDCPYPKTPYPILRDRTHKNWLIKRDIYRASKLYVATPCQWLMDKVSNSILADAVVDAKVIPNGVDQAIFNSGDKTEARQELALPPDRLIVLFSANSVRQNPWKDFSMLRDAARALGESHRLPCLFLAMGESGEPEKYGKSELRYVPRLSHGPEIARYYRAADLYVHPSKADTFPNVVIEALSCGTPVVATAIGGIPEQIISMPGKPDIWQTGYDASAATGYLVRPGDTDEFVRAMAFLLSDRDLLARLGRNAAEDAKIRFSADRMGSQYMGWFEDIASPDSASSARNTHEAPADRLVGN